MSTPSPAPAIADEPVAADLNHPLFDAYFKQREKYFDSLPRYILWDSKHPDYPVEWSNPGRPIRDGEIGFFRHDIVNELVNEASTAPTSPAPTAAEPAAVGNDTSAVRNEGFNAGTIAALAILATHDSEVQWREVLEAAGEEQVLYYAAHVEPEDWKWGGFAQYKMRKPKKRAALAATTESAPAATPRELTAGEREVFRRAIVNNAELVAHWRLMSTDSCNTCHGDPARCDIHDCGDAHATAPTDAQLMEVIEVVRQVFGGLTGTSDKQRWSDLHTEAIALIRDKLKES